MSPTDEDIKLADGKSQGNHKPHSKVSPLVVTIWLTISIWSTFTLTMTTSEESVNFQALLFPSDGRPPTLVSMKTSLMPSHHSSATTTPSRVPHPEVFMDYIAEGMGSRAWKYHLVEALDGMSRKFANPYIIFYPTVSRDGMQFPINKVIKEIQGNNYREEFAWRGNIVVAKYRDNPFTSMIDASMADFPILKNYLLTHGAPR